MTSGCLNALTTAAFIPALPSRGQVYVAAWPLVRPWLRVNGHPGQGPPVRFAGTIVRSDSRRGPAVATGPSAAARRRSRAGWAVRPYDWAARCRLLELHTHPWPAGSP